MFFLYFFPYLPTLHLSLVRPSNNKLIWCGLIAIKNVVKIPVEIATFQNHQFHSLVRVLDYLVTTTVTTPISTEVIVAVTKLLVTTTRVTAILVTAILVTAMLCQVKNIVFITRMLKCQCSTCQDSFLLVIS